MPPGHIIAYKNINNLLKILMISTFMYPNLLNSLKILCLSNVQFGPERSEGPYQMASERFTDILSTWFRREIKFFVFLSIS